jgi:RNA polymerase sigma-70 factor (ECF subfamily)
MKREDSSVSLKESAAETYGPSPMQAETTRLMLLARSGDRDAFDRLCHSVRDLAFRLAQSLVGSRDDALELAQEALMHTYRARATFREGEHFLPWFRRILRNTCYSWLRRQGKVRASSSSQSGAADEAPEEWDLVDPDAVAPHEPMIADERVAAFRRALARLSTNDREILVLRHYREHSYREIAHLLSIPEGTVMSRLFHARRRLREALGPQYAEEFGERGGSDGARS